MPDEPHLQARHTFETFVLGESNQLAAAAARTLAESPASAGGALLIHGGSGLGKTHLLHGIGNCALALKPEVKVLYASSEQFASDLIEAVHFRQTEASRRRYRGNGILLIDDVDFLVGKTVMLEEFVHTCAALRDSGGRLAVASTAPPEQLGGLWEGLSVSREGGLETAPVQPPGLDTRLAILRQTVASEVLDVPEAVLEHIATRVTSNVRELKGALLRVTALARIHSKPVDLPLAKSVLRESIGAPVIIRRVAQSFSLATEQVVGPSRTRAATEARQIAMYLCRELTDMSLPQIGREFGGRDHASVLAACRKVTASLAEEPGLRNRISVLTSAIEHQSNSWGSPENQCQPWRGSSAAGA